jgi:methionyl-tRNA synthetase
MLEWENAGKFKLLSVGYTLRAPELLFRKIDDTEVTYQIEKLHKSLEASKINIEEENAAPAFVPVKSEIVFDDFAKIDLRVGKILSAEKVEKADKLLKLEVLLGFETRTIVSGIALHFKPEEIVGKQVTVVVNLAPRKMRGIESNGMILMAEDANGKLHFINPEDAIGEGATVN